MKSIKEKEECFLDGFCGVTAAAAGILSIFYLFDILQNQWFLSFIIGFAVLLHVALSLLFFIRRKHVRMSFAILVAVFYSGCLIYFNL